LLCGSHRFSRSPKVSMTYTTVDLLYKMFVQ
jgi:hypothetical protein